MSMSTEEFMRRLVEEGIKPHAEQIAAIALRGAIACVVFEPMGVALKMLAVWQWKGEAVFELSRKRLQLMARTDYSLKRWIAVPPSERKIKILAVVHEGTLLINSEPSGFSIEPGSTDRERLS